jgi:hypothetical protein
MYLGGRELQVKIWAWCIESEPARWGSTILTKFLRQQKPAYQQSEDKNQERWMETEGSKPFEEHDKTAHIIGKVQ